MNHHENKRERLERLGRKLKTGAGTQIGVPICFTEYPQLSSLAAELWTPCCPLPVRSGGGKPFVQGWTHTGRRIRRFLQKPVAGVVVVSFLDIEPHELSRSSFSAGGWKGVFANGVES